MRNKTEKKRKKESESELDPNCTAHDTFQFIIGIIWNTILNGN